MSPTQPAADRAYAAVKRLVLDGELAGGELISENALSTRLGMSRTPMRAAFQRLAAEGWLTLYPKRGAVVAPVTADERREVLEARLLIEANAVDTIPDAARAPLLEELAACAREQEHAAAEDDLGTFAELDVRFHRAIVAAGGNTVLLDFYDALRERQRRMVESSVHASPIGADAVAADHAALADLVAAGDGPGFAAYLREHLESVHGVRLAAPTRKDPK